MPIAAFVLLVVVLGFYTLLAYRAVAVNAQATATERIRRLANELARNTSTSSTAHMQSLAKTLNGPAFQRAFRTKSFTGMDSALEVLATPTDSTLDVSFYDAARRRIFVNGNQPDPEALTPLDTLFGPAARNDSMAVASPIVPQNGKGSIWTVAAVRDGNTVVGYIAQIRQIRTTKDAERTIDALIGADSRIVYANTRRPLSEWFALDGSVLHNPENVKIVDNTLHYQRDGDSYIGAIETIANTPYSLVVETSVSAARSRATAFLRQVGAIALVLLILATAFVWIVSRRFTRPLSRLSDAAGAIARGEYERRVDVQREDEIGALAESFNRMAGEIQTTMHEAQQSRAEAELANRTKSEFLANMSHEIRTPINAMLGYADLMEAGVSGPVTSTQEDQLRRIKTSGKHLIGLIDDLLDFARIETARLTVQSDVVSASDSIRTALTVVDPQAGRKNIQLHSQCSADARYVGDPKRVEQILVNLLGNAVKFTPENGSVSIECAPRNKRIEFIVTDTGIGIPANRIDAIFEPFVQAHGGGYTRRHGGTGLGLAISRRLAELMHGTLTVQSREGEGSRFVLTLPAAEK